MISPLEKRQRQRLHSFVVVVFNCFSNLFFARICLWQTKFKERFSPWSNLSLVRWVLQCLFVSVTKCARFKIGQFFCSTDNFSVFRIFYNLLIVYMKPYRNRIRIIFLIFSYCFGLVSCLNCTICRHKGVSMIPPSAPNSRFIFDSTNDSCDEEDIKCESREDFCIGASAKAAEKKYWVQKGCVKGTGGGNGSGCTEEYLDVTNAKNLPVGVVKGKLLMTVCICNTKDFCNRGYVGRLGRQQKNSSNHLSSINLTIFVLILMISARFFLFSKIM